MRRGDARDGREDVPNELTAVDGREGPLLFPPINPLVVAAGELEESLLGGAEARTVSLIRPGLPVGDGKRRPTLQGGTPGARAEDDRAPSVTTNEKATVDCADVLPQW